MKSKLISVIVPIFNGDKYIGRCLRSLLSQSLSQEDFEIILINDGSFDNTDFALKLFEGGIIRVLKNKKNMGLPYSLNKGIKKSKGKYIVRVDADDYVNKDFLLILKRFLEENPNMDAVSCDYQLVDSDENLISIENSEDNPIGCAIMFKKQHLLKIGMYDEDMKINEEKDLIFRFKKFFSIYRIQIPLYRYRKHENNITNNIKNVQFYDSKLKKKHK